MLSLRRQVESPVLPTKAIVLDPFPLISITLNYKWVLGRTLEREPLLLCTTTPYHKETIRTDKATQLHKSPIESTCYCTFRGGDILCVFPGNRGPFCLVSSLFAFSRPSSDPIPPIATHHCRLRTRAFHSLVISSPSRLDHRPVTHACSSGNNKPRTPLPVTLAHVPSSGTSRGFILYCALQNSRADSHSAIQRVLSFPDKLPCHNDEYILYSLSADLLKMPPHTGVLATPPWTRTLEFSSYASPLTPVSATVAIRSCRSSIPIGIPALPAPTPSTFFLSFSRIRVQPWA